MRSFQRSQVQTLLDRLNEPPRHILAVFGPRQTGKTTIVRQALQSTDRESRYLAVDDPDDSGFPVASLGTELTGTAPGVRDTQWLVDSWNRAREIAQHGPRGYVLAIDEIQRIPDWSQTVKGLWDADRSAGCPMHVVVLGSAPLIVQSGLSESLAGRFERIFVPHWTFKEMGDAFDFDLESYLFFGAYPGAAHFLRDERRWRDYLLDALIEPNIERDILAMTRVDKPTLLKRLFEAGATQSGEILSYNKMLGQLDDAGNTTTLARYLESALERGSPYGSSQIFPTAVSVTWVEPEIECPQYGSHDGCFRLYVRGSEGGPPVLGPCGGKCGRRTPLQHRDPGYQRLLLAGKPVRGGFHPAARAAARGDRSKDRGQAAPHARFGGF